MDVAIEEPLLTLGLAALLIISMLARSLLSRVRVPGLVAFLVIGVVIRWLTGGQSGLPEGAVVLLDVLGKLGVIALLFRAGLETNLAELLGQASSAIPIWLANVVVVGGLSFATTWYIAGMAVVPSLVIAVALTATSVGISVAIWEERGKADSRAGELFLGVAGLDDISAVSLMAVLFAVAPQLRAGSAVGGELMLVLAWTLVKIALFAGGCYLFSRFVEHKLREKVYALETPAAALLTIVSISIVIASVAGLMGFSVAIGAFFAGLAFSKDPEAVRQQTAFDLIYDLFVPFFFIGIGLSIDLSVAIGAAGLGLLLLIPAVAGKLIANGLTALPSVGTASALAIGVSMVPRAEITMVVMQRAGELGPWAASDRAYAAVTFVTLVTALIAPVVLQVLIHRVPDQ